MKKTAIAILLVIISMNISAQNKGTIADEVVAVVGKNIVKLSDIESNYAQIRIQRGYENPFENRCQILESLLLSKLLLHKGEVDSVEVTEQMISQELEWRLKALVHNYGSKENLLKQTGKTYEEVKEYYTKLITENSKTQMVEDGITSNVKITPYEVQEFYKSIPADSIPMMDEEYELSEIVLEPTINDAEKERLKLQLNTLRERILKGENFAMLATMYSEDPGSAVKGGELGFFGRGDMVSEFEAAAFVLKPGEVSPVIETKFGFHIIQLIERRGNTINARHILLCPKVSTEDLIASQKKMDSIVSLINGGEISFEDAARRYSASATKSLGGVVSNSYLGNRFTKEILAQSYPELNVESMKVGDISPIKMVKNESNQNIFRVMKLNKKVEAHKANLTDDYDKIYNIALQKAKNDKILDWANKMIKNTYIKLNDDYKNCEFKLNWLKNK